MFPTKSDTIVGLGIAPAGAIFLKRAVRRLTAYIQSMPRKPIELPPAVARSFVRDMKAFHAEKSPLKRDDIASRQIHVLRQYQGKSERPIKLHQVKEIFLEMKDQV